MGLFKIPKDVRKDLAKEIDGAWDQVRANLYAHQHGRDDLINQKMNLAEIKAVINQTAPIHFDANELKKTNKKSHTK